MTQIAYMSGLPVNEYRQRSGLVLSNNYIPYSAMTEGEVKLALLGESLKIDSAYYPESASLKKAVMMVENALYGGISGGVDFVGVMPDELMNIARAIDQYSRSTAPASKLGIMNRSTPGIRIGEPIVPVKYGAVDCKDYTYDIVVADYKKHRDSLSAAVRLTMPPPPPRTGFHTTMMNFPIKKYREMYQKLYLDCTYMQTVEGVLNANLERASLHMLYHRLSTSFEPAIGTLASTKRLLHRAGVSDLGRTAKVSEGIMSAWVELGQKRTAVQGGLRPELANSQVLTAMLTPNPQVWTDKMLADIKTRGGSSIGEPITLAAVTALVVAIGGALKHAVDLQNAFQAKQINAMQNAQGFGSTAYSPEKDDFLKAKGDTPLTPPSEGSDNLLLIGGGLAALYFMSK